MTVSVVDAWIEDPASPVSGGTLGGRWTAWSCSALDCGLLFSRRRRDVYTIEGTEAGIQTLDRLNLR
jgi:hypothetical protein